MSFCPRMPGWRCKLRQSRDKSCVVLVWRGGGGGGGVTSYAYESYEKSINLIIYYRWWNFYSWLTNMFPHGNLQLHFLQEVPSKLSFLRHVLPLKGPDDSILAGSARNTVRPPLFQHGAGGFWRSCFGKGKLIFTNSPLLFCFVGGRGLVVTRLLDTRSLSWTWLLFGWARIGFGFKCPLLWLSHWF